MNTLNFKYRIWKQLTLYITLLRGNKTLKLYSFSNNSASYNTADNKTHLLIRLFWVLPLFTSLSPPHSHFCICNSLWPSIITIISQAYLLPRISVAVSISGPQIKQWRKLVLFIWKVQIITRHRERKRKIRKKLKDKHSKNERIACV